MQLMLEQCIAYPEAKSNWGNISRHYIRIICSFQTNLIVVNNQQKAGLFIQAAGNETENCDVMLDCSKYLKNLS